MNSSLARAAARCGVVLTLLLAVSATIAVAQPVAIPETWGGDFWSRPRLTGSWGGFRDEMGKKGIVFDADLLMIPQGILTGGTDQVAKFWGLSEYTLNLDTGKAGLWPGGFLRVYALSGFGEGVGKDVAAVAPVNYAAVVPDAGNEGTALMNLSFMQFFSPHVGIVVGKLYTLDADANDFAHGFHSTFLNMNFGINTANALFPLSAYGGSVVILPWEGAIITAGVVDPSGTPQNNDISEAFRDGVLVSAEGRVTIKPFGLLGHQLIGFGWSNKERVSLVQDPSNIARALVLEQFPRLQDPGPVLRRILERFFPELLVPVQELNRKKDTWSVYYNFDQYLWHPDGDQTRGIGAFFRFGVSDGNPNPIKYAYNVGLGGKGLVPGRLRDTFGIGWARTQLSDDFVPFLRERLNLGLSKEDAVEMYYNFSITPAINATLDLQIVDPALRKTLNKAGDSLENVNTAVIAGLRIYARF